jgi:hypothetical protein
VSHVYFDCSENIVCGQVNCATPKLTTSGTYQHTLARVIGQVPANNRMYSDDQTFFTSWRGVTGNIQNQPRQVRGFGLLQLGVLGFGLLVDGDVRVGIFPEGKEIPVRLACGVWSRTGRYLVLWRSEVLQQPGIALHSPLAKCHAMTVGRRGR